jgi:cation:H+ antiporter
MILDAVLFAIGIGLLAVASEHFVLGASRIALGMRIPAVVVGAVVIGFGTSAPELLVSGLAAAQGSPQLGLGNVLGSNIANALLVAGVAAIMMPLLLQSRTIRREAPIALLATMLLAGVLAVDGELDRIDGVVLVLALVVALMATLIGARSSPGDALDPLDPESLEFVDTILPVRDGLRREWIRTLIGLAGTIAGSQLLVQSASSIAREIGISEVVIGVTVVAIGTSLPEIAATIQAARRREGDLIIGNVLGSNMFNSLGVAGVVALIAPTEVGRSTWLLVAPLGVAATGLMTVLLVTNRRLGRTDGIVLLVLYALLLPVLLRA